MELIKRLSGSEVQSFNICVIWGGAAYSTYLVDLHCFLLHGRLMELILRLSGSEIQTFNFCVVLGGSPPLRILTYLVNLHYCI